MKRFYRDATVQADTTGFAILLDGKFMHTPGQNVLAVPTAALAGAIAREWQDQGEDIDPMSMPLTRLANVVIDGVVPRAQDLIDSIAGYAETDLICYWADYPDALTKRHAERWLPWIRWAERRFGARLVASSGVMFQPQPDDAVAALREAVSRFDPWRLGPLHMLTTSSGSLILALAVAERELDVEEAFALSELDEAFQRQYWGEDAEAAERSRHVRADMLYAARFLALLDE